MIIKAVSREHANALCDLIQYVNCINLQKRCINKTMECGAWKTIDPFVRLLLEVKFKRKERL